MTFVAIAAGWGFSVSFEKNILYKVMSMGCPEGNLLIQLESSVIATVDKFTYLESNIINDGEVVSEVSARLGKAARAFGCLQSSIFDSQALSVQIKRGVYCAVLMSTLLYGSDLETWAVKSPRIRRSEGFYNHCILVIMGVSKTEGADNI